MVVVGGLSDEDEEEVTLEDLSEEPFQEPPIHSNPGEKRARWRNKILIKSDKTDSGYQEQQESKGGLPQLLSNDGISERKNEPLSKKNSWHYRRSLGNGNPNTRLKSTFSVPLSNANNNIETGEEGDRPTRFLSRKNGVRYSVRNRSPSPSQTSSISSESESSQVECETTIDPICLLPENGIRKHSVFFASYGVWSEESVVQTFVNLSSSISSILEGAWTGQTETLQELFRNEENLANINCRDGNGRTPLHLAAACGHLTTVEFLLEKGADVDAYDPHMKATALMAAAACGSLPVVEILLAHGANVNAGYEFGKTALHWAVQAASVECAKKFLESGAKQNPPIVYSETPLHIAAALGDPACLRLLLEYGADVSLCKGSTSKSTALHLASEEGSSECINVLLKAGASLDVKDARGHTPLHIAAATDADATATLLSAGADPNAVDCNGRTPLHCAVARGSRAAECVRLIVDSQAEINCQDTFGYSPLHLAAVNESSQCASILLHAGGDVTTKTNAGTTALSLLVRRIPDVMRFLSDRLDEAVTIHDHDPGDPDCEIKLDFRAVVPNSEKRILGKNKRIPEKTYYHKPRKETEFLTCLLAAGNKKILAHPLSEAFLTLKWRRVRKFFWASLLFQIALVLLFTVYVVEVYLIKCPMSPEFLEGREEVVKGLNGLDVPDETPPDAKFSENLKLADRINETHHISKRSAFNWFSFGVARKEKSEGEKEESDRTTSPPVTHSRMGSFNVITPPKDPLPTDSHSKTNTTGGSKLCEIDLTLTIIWCLLIGFALMMAIKEVFQFLQAPLAYIVSSENWGQWALIVSVTIAAWPMHLPYLYLSYWMFPAAALGIFLAWGLLLLQVGRFPSLGLYVQMLGKVAANFGVIILTYACLLIAFAFAFCVIFPEHPSYSSVPLAILKVLTMMVGEVDYEDLFYREDKKLLYPITAHFLHGAFVIIVTIVLMNLLVGLAVNDIAGLQKGAKLNRLSRQTALISRLESFIFSKRLQACLPKSVGTLLQKSALLVPSSYNWSYYVRPNDPRDRRLPKELKIAALRLASSKLSARHLLKGYSSDRQILSSQSFSNSHDVGVRRIEKKIEILQGQFDSVLRSMNEKFEKITNLLESNKV